MKRLYVESNKKFNQGFVLTEPELRRLIDLCNEQLKKNYHEGKIEVKYTIKFENGVVADTDNIDNVLTQENTGMSKIIFLSVMLKDDRGNIKVDFANSDSENIINSEGVRYSINGDSRDWVFITSSLLEERINKIRRKNFNYILSGSRIRFYLLLLFTISFFIGVLIPISTIKTKEKIDALKEEWQAGKLKDPIEGIIRVAEAQSDKQPMSIILYPFAIFGVFLLLILLIYIYFIKLYPIYNFCWGDYLQTYNKKENNRKTFNTVIIIGLAISIVGGIIANYLGKI